MKSQFIARPLSRVLLLGAILLLFWTAASAAPGSVAPNFQYNIIRVERTEPGQYPMVTFSVTDPTNGQQAYDLKTHPAFTRTANGTSRLAIQIGWDTRDYTNAGSGSNRLPMGAGAALPIAIDALRRSVSNGDGSYTVTSTTPIPADATGTGVVALEGHPAGPDATGAYTVRLQVKSVFRYVPIRPSGGPIVPRRSVVEIGKCLNCHGTLSLHGNNRTDTIEVCVICHNSGQTDIPFRVAGDGPEVPVDFKTMVHAIHAGAERENPFTVIGFGHSINDYSHVVFPAELSNCLNCHIDRRFELPLDPNVRGTTIDTRSVITPAGKIVDADPANDLKISPIAATCSGCHDSGEVRSHMTRMGASFSALQSQIDSGQVRERCVDCHGPGKEDDVRRVHEIRAVGGPTQTPRPTETRRPTQTPEATETRRPTRTPEATETRRPTSTPAASVTPGSGRVELEGRVQTRPSGPVGLWQIGGQRVWVDAGTRFDEEKGPAAVGANVAVVGVRRAGGDILASRIKTLDSGLPGDTAVKLRGSIQQLPAAGLLGTWQVAGRAVTVAPTTHLNGNPASYRVGVTVKVYGAQTAAGAITAREVEIEYED